MKYYVIEGKPDGKYNATSKARNDAETILRKNGIKEYYIKTVNGVQNNKLLKWKQLLDYKKNTRIWNNSLSKLKEKDVVFIQYPILNTAMNLDRVLNKYKKRGIIFVALVHDMDSLRYKPEAQGKMLYKRICKEDKLLLNEMNYIIAHNYSMKSKLIELGINDDRIVEMQLFDYLVDKKTKVIERRKGLPIIIAGNLAPEKSKYLTYLNKLEINFNLYGVGYDETMAGPNISYKGKYKPDELLDHLEGGFGLVWDGISIETCIGGFGEYLRYNNPHKASLYLTAGIPVIVWKESAISKIIIDNKLGFAVNNLNEIGDYISKLTDNEYDEMIKNVKKVSSKLKKGEFITNSINLVMEKINEEV